MTGHVGAFFAYFVDGGSLVGSEKSMKQQCSNGGAVNCRPPSYIGHNPVPL
jgi:hypothetical protein